MSSQAINRMQFDQDPDAIFKVLASAEFQKQNLLNQGNPAVEIEVADPAGDVLKMVANVTEYAKGVAGVDKSKTEQTRTDFRWNLKDRVCEWTHESAQGKRVKVWGRVEARPSGSGTELIEEFNLDIKIPLLGGKIEKMVIKEAKKYWPKYEALVREYLAKPA